MRFHVLRSSISCLTEFMAASLNCNCLRNNCRNDSRHTTNVRISVISGGRRFYSFANSFLMGVHSRNTREAEQISQEYTELWREVCGTVRALERQLSDKSREEDAAEKEEEQMDVAFQELRRCENAIRQVEPEIRKYEEYLQREDIREKAQRLDALKQDKQSTEKSLLELRERIAVIDTTLELTQRGRKHTRIGCRKK